MTLHRGEQTRQFVCGDGPDNNRGGSGARERLKTVFCYQNLFKTWVECPQFAHKIWVRVALTRDKDDVR